METNTKINAEIDSNRYERVDKPIVRELDRLLMTVPETELRRSLNQLMYSYLTQSYEIERDDFKVMIKNVACLVEFLERVCKKEENSTP
jgi:hypothetical protein